jgi:hypothetical protein
LRRVAARGLLDATDGLPDEYDDDDADDDIDPKGLAAACDTSADADIEDDADVDIDSIIEGSAEGAPGANS